MFNIEKNVPIPIFAYAGTLSFPFDEMEVGDSFVIPKDKRSSLSKHKNKFLANNPEKDFIIRNIGDNTVRIWRTK